MRRFFSILIRPRVFPLVLAGILSLIVERLKGEVFFWNGTGTTWNDPASWSPNVDGTGTGQIPGSDDIAWFNASTVSTTSQTISLDANQSASGVTIDAPSGTSVTIQGGGANRTLQLGTDGITVGSGVKAFNLGSTTANQNVNVSLMGDQSWLFNGANFANNGIFVKNAVSLGVTGAHTLTLGGSSGSTSISGISGNISDGSGVLSLTLDASSGSNRWNIGGNNTYTGVTTISSGALGISHANALGSTVAGTVVESGAALFLRASMTIAPEALSLAGQGPAGAGALRNVAGTSTWTGVITASTTNGSLRIGADSGTLTLSPTADITVTGSNALEFTTNGAASGGNIVVNSNISGGMAVSKIVGTTTTLTFGGDNKDYTGATSVNAGALILNTGLTATSAVNVASGAALRGDGGTVNAAATTTVNGILGPGADVVASLGTLTTGSLSLTSTATFQLDISAGTHGADLVNVFGNLALDTGNATVLTITDLDAILLGEGTVFVFIDYSGTWNGGLFTVDGTVIGDNANTFTVGGNEYQIDYNYGGDNGAVTLVVTPTPEPSVAFGLVSGLGLLLGSRRRRKV